jgi:hypothetical protein
MRTSAECRPATSKRRVQEVLCRIDVIIRLLRVFHGIPWYDRHILDYYYSSLNSVLISWRQCSDAIKKTV